VNSHSSASSLRVAVPAHVFYFALVVFPVCLIAFSLWLETNRPWSYQQNFLTAHGAVAYGTCTAYILACVTCCSFSTRLYTKNQRSYALLYVLLAVFLFWRAGEALNWGELLVDQHTITTATVTDPGTGHSIHRFLCQLSLSSVFIAVAFYGAFSRLIIYACTQCHSAQSRDLLTPAPALIGYSLPAFALYMYNDYLNQMLTRWLGSYFSSSAATNVSQHFLLSGDQQSVQFLLGLGFLFFVVTNLYRYGSSVDRPPKAVRRA